MFVHNKVRSIFIILSIGLASAAILNENNLIHCSTALSLFFNLAAVFFIYVHYILIPPKSKKKFLRLYIFYAAVLYLLFLLSLLFVDPEFSRDMLFNGDINNRYNIVPLHTILLYINGYKKGILLLSELIINLLGNFIAFMPLGFFLPRLFSRLNHVIPFVLTTAVFISAIEIMQFILRSGVCDVDDLILNLTGALIVYFLMRKRNIHTNI